MTSVAVFNSGPTGASGVPSLYAWAIQHGTTAQSSAGQPQQPQPTPWPSPGEVSPSRSWAPHGGWGQNAGPDSDEELYDPPSRYANPAHPDPRVPGPGRGLGHGEPVPWLAAPPLSDPWQSARPWGASTGAGTGVVSLLPWFLGMTIVGGADNPGRTPSAPSAPAGGSARSMPPLSPSSSASRQTPNRPSGSTRPGPARPGTRIDPSSSRPVATENGRLNEIYRWKRVDYVFPSAGARMQSMAQGDFVPDNNLPLGVEAYKDRIFVSIPRWRPGVPATLAYVPRYPNGDRSPLLRPYPDWSWHRVPRAGQNDSCMALTSVFRMAADECGRLWVLDSGAIDTIGDIKIVCPPQIVIFDLNTDQLLWRYVIPADQRKPESLFTNIAVDIRDGQCDDAYAYSADVFRYGLLVYSWREDRSYRLNHNFFFPDPIAARFVLDEVVFRWMDGVFGLGLSPVDENGDRTLFFHPMASFREFAVQTSLIRNETLANANPDEFYLLGVRGRNQSHSSASAMDRRGVLFFNLVTQDALGCWDSSKSYSSAHVGHVAQDHQLINFPNDLKVDMEEPQNIWLLSNRLHLYLYRSLSPNEYNFRILTGTVDKATEGTICDPNKVGPQTTVPKEIDACDSL